MKKAAAVLFFMALSLGHVSAQCAMCRATLENNFSAGNPGIAAGINTGILYLFAAPYLAVAAIAYFWYRSSRRNAHMGVR